MYYLPLVKFCSRCITYCCCVCSLSFQQGSGQLQYRDWLIAWKIWDHFYIRQMEAVSVDALRDNMCRLMSSLSGSKSQNWFLFRSIVIDEWVVRSFRTDIPYFRGVENVLSMYSICVSCCTFAWRLKLKCTDGYCYLVSIGKLAIQCWFEMNMNVEKWRFIYLISIIWSIFKSEDSYIRFLILMSSHFQIANEECENDEHHHPRPQRCHVAWARSARRGAAWSKASAWCRWN